MVTHTTILASANIPAILSILPSGTLLITHRPQPPGRAGALPGLRVTGGSVLAGAGLGAVGSPCARLTKFRAVPPPVTCLTSASVRSYTCPTIAGVTAYRNTGGTIRASCVAFAALGD